MALKLSDLPDITFAEKDPEIILNDMVSGYENAYFESTGVSKKLYPGDPIRIFLYSQALREIQLRHIIDNAAKQNLLKYSTNDNLRHLGAFMRTDQLEPTRAESTVKFTLSQIMGTDVTIPAGTRVGPGGNIYFYVKEDATILAGQSSIDVSTKCLTPGAIGNGFLPGQINILVDPLPWNSSVSNIDTSNGGADLENEDNYRERIHLAPEGFSVAGPEGAYEYFSREYSSLIADLKISSPSPNLVSIKVLLQNGELPTDLFLSGLLEYLNDKERRPLTDKVEASAPDTVSYDLNLTYYIRNENSGVEETIQAQIQSAIDEYEIWQRLKIGRDINPSTLISKIIAAGAKRVEVISPGYALIDDNSVAVASLKTINYGGLEDE